MVDFTICLFAKPPVPGRVKTRLAAGIGAHQAARLAEAFVRDTWAYFEQKFPGATIVATTGALGPQLGIPVDRQWDQGEGDLGARIERILRRALDRSPVALAVGADSPAIPARLIENALANVREEQDASLGPTEDGGFYLLGVRRCEVGLLDGIPWSASTTATQTRRRLEQAGRRVTVLSAWFDVDEPDDLDRLRSALESGEIEAPATRRVLASV